ncbi:MAG TPA: alpha/beta hydrolase [Candidatus Macondimonas sp.]|nr:alpha/beta hydrolase [Candidatus Macondimonas sp.]
MMWLWCLLLIGGIAALRQRQLDRPTLPIYAKDFDGEILRIGACHALVRRAAATPRATVVCVPGFLEEVWYFDGLYEDADLDCIYLNNADYHVTTVAPEARAQAVDWDRPLPYAVGTISHDAAVLNQVLTHLVRSGPIRLHGHSRGGAVVLEAALQSPELHRRLEIEYLLEAPVLPQGRIHPSLALAATAPGLWLLPALFPLLRRLPMRQLGRLAFGPPRGQKLELASRLWFNARRARTVVTNVQDIQSWMRFRTTAAYEAFRDARTWILVADRDLILSRSHMARSARQTGEPVRVVEAPETSHMLAQDAPTAIPPVGAAAVGVVPDPDVTDG